MAVPNLSNTSDKHETIAWLRGLGPKYNPIASALAKNNDFEGVPDFLPVLRDEGIDNFKMLLTEAVNDINTPIKLKLVARLKQAMREALITTESAAPTTATTAKPDVDEVKGKLQDVRKLADLSWTNNDELAAIVSEEMSFHSDDIDKDKGPRFITNLYDALNGNGNDDQSVRHKRQLKIVGPSNNGKTELAQWMARMWVASATDRGGQGGWIETFVTMETMDAHLWSARESTGSAPREVWGPLRYLFYKAREYPRARFALVLHESNRGGLFNALNRIWWEKRRNFPSNEGVPDDERLPKNLALIFTENPATADYATIGDGDDALRTRLPPESTFALVRGGTNESELAELGFSGKEGRDFSTENVGLFYAMAKGGYDSSAWKRHLSCLAQEDSFEGVDFEDSFGMAPDEFRTRVAGEQIDIIRTNPPDSDATHPQPGAQQPNAESKLGKKRKEIRDHLTANSEITWLAFVHEDVATATKKENIRHYYKYLRTKIQGEEKKATVQELWNIAQRMTEAEKRDLAWNDCNFGRGSTTTEVLVSWIAYTRENGPSVKIVHNGSELT